MERRGSSQNLMRFTLHSLGNRYANTALQVWKYTETVRPYFSGITDQTLAQVIAIRGWGCEVKTN